MGDLLKLVVAKHDGVFGADKFLKFLQYALNIYAGAALSRGGAPEMSQAMSKLASTISTGRTASHFCGGCFGLPSEIDNLLNGTFVGGWKDPKISAGIKAQSMAMILYYPMEHACWIKSNAPALLPTFDADTWSTRSMWMFSVWLGLEVYVCLRRLKELDRMEARAGQRHAAIIRRKRKMIHLNLLKTLLSVPAAYQYSLLPTMDGLKLPGSLVVACSTAECVLDYYLYLTSQWNSCPQLPE